MKAFSIGNIFTETAIPRRVSENFSDVLGDLTEEESKVVTLGQLTKFRG